jgi:cell wall-associated NlpC family hydrolase
MSQLVASSRKYLGVKFRHMGRGPNVLDCAGLILRAYADIGVKLPDLKHYGREPHKDGLRGAVVRALGDNLNRPPIVGDVLLMAFDRDPHHLGIVGDYMYGGLSLIHAYGDVGKVVEHRLDYAWRKKVLEVYRMDV